MGQLQSELDEGIRAGAALLYLAFSKVIKRNNVGVHIISQILGNFEGVLNYLLALKEDKKDTQCHLFLRNIILTII